MRVDDAAVGLFELAKAVGAPTSLQDIGIKESDLDKAAKKVKTGDTLIISGFGMTGNPTHLLHAFAETEVSDLTYIGNNVGEPGLCGGRLLQNKHISKSVGSYFISNREAVEAAQ